MDQTDTRTSQTDVKNFLTDCESIKRAYTSGPPEDGKQFVVRGRQKLTRAFCRLAQGDEQGCREDIREAMQYLDGHLEGSQ